MSRVAIKVLTTVTAPYGGSLSAHDLAGRIADPGSAERCDPLVFAFFSEVSPGLQQAFIDEMHVDLPRRLQRLQDCGLGDLVEDEPLGLALRLQLFQQVP